MSFTILHSVIAVTVPYRFSRAQQTDLPDYMLRAQAVKWRLRRRRHLPSMVLSLTRVLSNFALKPFSNINVRLNVELYCPKIDRISSGMSKGRQTKAKPSVTPLRDSNNILCTADTAKANILQNQFVSIYTVDNGDIPTFEKLTNLTIENVVPC
jgi:hypothetical protein